MAEPIKNDAFAEFHILHDYENIYGDAHFFCVQRYKPYYFV